MERRHFLKLAVGFAAGAAALAAGAQAAPLMPQPPAADGRIPLDNAHPAVVTGDEVDRLTPEEVRWGRGRGHHHGWGRRHWGWRRRHWGWRRRHWGWHRRRWHRRRYWRRRYW
ncbi:twin-arginine translocation signal domain-containing protein [Bradyrhizobium sediminis]|uniref:Twin-arginine translocation signal domain-containing protein n=1 Tax=Bradyrhizobium sediminis TaxID=2840469 RepID=A0A975NK13_9BRAD|nr:twin-arginine translocation signal domain-containing protein [Bradyrhizobium sediminis]QWG16583.1 twin-arginine translocation signal domain-containing protein [Bradyrhizobium sediminis]